MRARRKGDFEHVVIEHRVDFVVRHFHKDGRTEFPVSSESSNRPFDWHPAVFGIFLVSHVDLQIDRPGPAVSVVEECLRAWCASKEQVAHESCMLAFAAGSKETAAVFAKETVIFCRLSRIRPALRVYPDHDE